MKHKTGPEQYDETKPTLKPGPCRIHHPAAETKFGQTMAQTEFPMFTVSMTSAECRVVAKLFPIPGEGQEGKGREGNWFRYPHPPEGIPKVKQLVEQSPGWPYALKHMSHTM
jgi:hypothetical protein